MNRIRVLSEAMANQIAAGEVIERPASVVKELVENALDAGATQIEVEVAGGGRSLVRVSDDGTGMSRDDAILSIERHSTSKIHDRADLANITTMGFRGEALPSIAAVSRLTITTRERDAETGTFVKIDAGRLINVVEVGRAPGTTVEVKQLFRNVPARRKYLRSAEREMGEIARTVDTYALAHPGVYLSLMHDGKVVALMPKTEHFADRLAAVFGRQLVEQMVPVSHRARGFAVTGAIGKPSHTRSNRVQQYMYVNGRPIWHTGVSRAVEEGYRSLLMRGRYPVAVLFIEVDPAQVDPNVHPTKRQVRFRNEWDLKETVAEAVAEALAGADLAPAASASRRNEPQIGTDDTDQEAPAATQQDKPAIETPVERSAFEQELAQSAAKQFWAKDAPKAPAPAELFGRPKAPRAEAAPMPVEAATGLARTNAPVESAAVEMTKEQPRAPRAGLRLKYLAQLRDSYLLAEDDEGLVVIDQHAAHERVLYERITAAVAGRGRTSQRLLMPRTVELTRREALLIVEHLDLFARMGFELRQFGPSTVLVEAAPTYMPETEWDALFRDILDEVDADQKTYRQRPEETLITAACKAAVKAHDTLTGAESVRLLADLAACERPFTCPHGRPTMIRMTAHDLEKEFKRR
jgi:DNA mismatch repair protein MutL